MLHALLIDDEVSARADLREKLTAHRDVTIVGEASTLLTGRALLASADYNLVFLDVQLIGGNSFDLVPLVRPGASIVFATAHERYAVRAFESHAVDYLLKPIDSARLAEALRRALEVLAQTRCSPEPTSAPDSLFGPVAANRSLALEKSHGRAEGPAEITLTRDEHVFLRQMLETWEDSLRPNHVLRTQRTLARTVRYARGSEPTRLFVAGAPQSAFARWWRALRA